MANWQMMEQDFLDPESEETEELHGMSRIDQLLEQAEYLREKKEEEEYCER